MSLHSAWEGGWVGNFPLLLTDPSTKQRRHLLLEYPTLTLDCSSLRVSFSLGPNTIHFLKFPLKYKSPWEGCCWNLELTPT